MTIGKMAFWTIAYATPLWLIILSFGAWLFGNDVDVLIDFGKLWATIFMGILAAYILLSLLTMLAKTVEGLK